ncbi:MAG: GTPase Era [Omnitrophica WOR_2 bacterium RIFCSPHIGHO2_02_FULL_52_10]|nr:MAG: GTPase Era [Omnitrophica WOR_2 bacterium RIFCSPHIGHO2_02_FULL_52_10]
MFSIVGRPNVGKSTLLNKIVGEKIAIVSRVPQTTRNQIRGLYNDERGQIIFIDTPGLHLGKDRLDKLMNQSASGTIEDADCVIYLVDSSRAVGEEERIVTDRLKNVRSHVILGLNKIDLKGRNVADYIALWEQAKGKPVGEIPNFTLLPLSGSRGTNIEKLIDILFEHLPEGPLLYPADIVCDVPQKLVIADVIREKFFQILKQEVPHDLGVIIEDMRPVRKNTMNIKALILVERETQKSIVIGKSGQVLKKAGTQARQELEELLGTKVFLECHVKAQKRWRDNVSLLQDCGYG